MWMDGQDQGVIKHKIIRLKASFFVLSIFADLHFPVDKFRVVGRLVQGGALEQTVLRRTN